MFIAVKVPYVQICNVFYYHENYYVAALSTKQYEYIKEPSLENYRIIATVFIFL